MTKKYKQDNKKVSILPILLVLSLMFIIAIPLIEYVNTPTDNTITSNRSIEIWTNITESSLANVTFNWNGTNYTIFDENLVLAYNFNNLSALGENNTHVYDISGNGNNGTVFGGDNITWTSDGIGSGNYDGAFNFSGNLNYIDSNDIGLNYNITHNHSIGFWVKHLSSSQEYILSDNVDSSNKVFNLIAEANNVLTYVFWNTSAEQINFQSSSIALSENWTYVFLSFDRTGKNMSMYINGFHMTSFDFSGLTNGTGTNRNLFIGSNRGTSNFLNGSIDELRIWNITKNSSEIEQLYFSNLKKFDSDSWQLYVNQSDLTNNRIEVGAYTYFSCATNSSGSENCTNTRSVTRQNRENITSNFSLSVRTVARYGQSGYRLLFTDNLTIDTDNDGVLDTISNYTWHREELLNVGITKNRKDMSLWTWYTNSSVHVFNMSGDLSHEIDYMNWAKANDIITLYGAPNHLPSWLANRTSGYCNESGALGWSSCSPYNYTLVGDMVVDYLERVGCTETTCEIECSNEPESTINWLNNLTSGDPIKMREYNAVCGNISSVVKVTFPNMKVGAPALHDVQDLPNNKNSSAWMQYALDNMTYLDFFSWHEYTFGSEDSIEFFQPRFDSLLANCTAYGNPNMCNDIRITEQNLNLKTVQELENISRWTMEFSLIYYLLNSNEKYQNFSNYIFQWGSRYNSSSSFYPSASNSRYVMVAEKGLDNAEATYYPPYNVTKNFATYCPTGATVYNSTSTTGDLVSVACKKDNDYTTIIINKGDEAINVTLNEVGGNLGEVNNLLTGETFRLSNGQFNIGILSQYEILYLGLLDAGLSTHLKLNENQGTTAYDVSGNANNGTISGATWNNDDVNVSLVRDTDFTISGNIFTIINPTYSWTQIIADYDYLVDSNEKASTDNMISNFTSGIDEVSIKIPTILLIVAVVFLFGALVLLVQQSKKMGIGNQGSL